MKTYTIQIGNSDNKLSQEMWASYHADVNDLLTPTAYKEGALEVHFHGASSAYEKWQNICWVVTINDEYLKNYIYHQLKFNRKLYNQDSIAIHSGDVEFI